ncbi:MAG TPA: TadE/TadG family type IV pilus assembly protein [Gemmatimonadota bacterium]|nr:TadE/TadG family type IV pilus assembly protein [Gemmatimonadota bacterium]
MMRRRSQRRRESGQSLLEFALILPVFLALVIGIFEFGRAWNIYQVLTNTAREGARLAVIPNSSEAQVRNTIAGGLQRAGLDPDLATVTIDGKGDGAGQPTTIGLGYPYEFKFLGPIVAFLKGPDDSMAGAITLSTTAVMRNE